MHLREELVIEIGPRRMRALTGAREGVGLRVTRALVEDFPATIDKDDVQSRGRWVGERLAAAGFPRGRATVALAREHVSLKRLTLPSTDANDLPGMTRLALCRDMPFDAEQAVIDFIVVERGETLTTVLAVAAPEAVLARTREIVLAAGLKPGRIGLRVLGSATLLRTLDPYCNACALAVDITACGVEMGVVEAGMIRFSRAASLEAAGNGPESVAAITEAVVTETRRTWMSYRITEEANDVTRVALLGDPDVTRAAADPIGEMLRAEAAPIDHHPLVTAADDAALDRVWPLAGMLIESMRGDETIDFSRPRKSVDLAAQRRRRVMMAAGVLVVLALALWTVGRRQLGRLETEVAGLRRQVTELQPAVQRYQRDAFVLSHLKRWESVDVRWLEHLLALRDLLPPAPETVLDGWTGILDFRGVRYDRKAKTWSVPMQLSIVVDGEARDRATADGLREALVQTHWYDARSSGADAPGGKRLPFGFTYRLTSTRGAPPDDEADAERAVVAPGAME